MKKIDVWATYSFECEKEGCEHLQENICDEFEWNPDKGCYTMIVCCEKCGTEYLAKRD